MYDSRRSRRGVRVRRGVLECPAISLALTNAVKNIFIFCIFLAQEKIFLEQRLGQANSLAADYTVAVLPDIVVGRCLIQFLQTEALSLSQIFQGIVMRETPRTVMLCYTLCAACRPEWLGCSRRPTNLASILTEPFLW